MTAMIEGMTHELMIERDDEIILVGAEAPVVAAADTGSLHLLRL